MTSEGSVGFVVVDREWHQSAEASRLLASIDQQLKGGGLLMDGWFPDFDLYSVKLLLVGSSGTGKSTLFSILTAPDVERAVATCETKGMQMARIKWAAKLTNGGDVALFSVDAWDAGHKAMQEYDHIKEECTQEAAVRGLVFSLKDKGSWAAAQRMAQELPESARFFIVGTHHDVPEEQWDVTAEEVAQFSSAAGVVHCFIAGTQRSDHVRIRRLILNLVCDTALRAE